MFANLSEGGIIESGSMSDAIDGAKEDLKREAVQNEDIKRSAEVNDEQDADPGCPYPPKYTVAPGAAE